MARKIQHKRGLEANLPQLDVAEIAFTTDSKKPFIGSADGNVEIAKKADVDAKASKTELTNAVSPKADKTYVDTELGKKASTDEVSALSAQLADTEKSLNLKKANAQVPLDIPTYYAGDNHALHPSVLYFPNKKYGYEYVMAFTPYSEMRDEYENPSIVVSNNRYIWEVPKGLTNPVQANTAPSLGYYSDPVLVDNGTQLEMWYRYTSDETRHSQIFRRTSTDCVNWSERELIMDFNQYDTGYVSPAVIVENGVYKLWYRNNAGPTGIYILRTSSDLATWSEATPLNFDFGEYSKRGYKSWHNEIKSIDGKYICIANAVADDGEYALFQFDSSDGINFGNVEKIMEPSLNGFDNDMLYKASIIKYGIWYYIYYSAIAKDRSNHIALTKRSDVTDSYSGMTAADLEYYRKTVMATDSLKSDRTQNYINVLSDLRLLEQKIRLVKTGVAEVRLDVSDNRDTLKVLTGGGTLPGYLETAGLYLKTSDNNAITGRDRLEDTVYMDSAKGRINVYKNGKVGEVAKIIHFRLTANGADGSVTYYSGQNYVESITSSGTGFRISFSGLPQGAVPSISITPTSELALQTSGGAFVQNYYVRTRTYLAAEIGMKLDNTTAGGQIPLNTVTSGSIEVTIFV